MPERLVKQRSPRVLAVDRMFHGASGRQGGEDAQDDEYEAAGHITHAGHDPEIDRTGCFFSSAQDIDPMGSRTRGGRQGYNGRADVALQTPRTKTSAARRHFAFSSSAAFLATSGGV